MFLGLLINALDLSVARTKVRKVVLVYSNISNTRDSISSVFPNNERRVENTTRSGVCLVTFSGLCTNAEARGSNPVEALKIFFRLKFAIAKIAITTAMITSQFHLYFRSSN